MVSLGTNARKTHPFALKNGYPWANEAVHAECLAIIRGRLEDYKDHYLVVLRVDNNGKLAMSKPCAHCQGLIKQMNLSKVYYTNENGMIESL